MRDPTAAVPRLVALRHRDFRLLWAGQLVSTIGTEMQFTALNLHIYSLLKGNVVDAVILGRTVHLDTAALGLGLSGLVRVVPIVVFALLGGLMADRFDRRRIMLVTQSAAGLVALALAAVSFHGIDQVAVIYALIALGAMAVAFDNPARQSFVPKLVPREHLSNAISLNTLQWQIATIFGPAITGYLLGVAHLSFGTVYLLNGLSFGAVVVALLAMRYRGSGAATATTFSWSALTDGFRFTFQSPLIWSTMLLDFLATFFSSARTMLPIIADQLVRTDTAGYGVLATAQAVGAVLAGSVVALRGEMRRQGVVLLVSVVLYGLATAFVGISTAFAASYVFLAVTGAADTVSTVIRGSIRQLMTPDHLRGRTTAVNMMFFMGGPQLGELEAGSVAAVLGVPFAIASGGVATVVLAAWIAWRYPVLRRLDRAEHAEPLEA